MQSFTLASQFARCFRNSHNDELKIKLLSQKQLKQEILVLILILFFQFLTILKGKNFVLLN